MIIEDDLGIRKMLENNLKKYNFRVFVCQDFTNITEEVQLRQPDLILLDINLPTFDGYYWCRQIRKDSMIPIIFISARMEDMDQVTAIQSGGDDYLIKPFSFEVVYAKITAHIRRSYGEYGQPEKIERIVSYQDLVLNIERLELYYPEKKVKLSKNERIILQLLIENSPKVVKRNTLLAKLWDTDVFVEENTVSVNITRARSKLKQVEAPMMIETVRGVGYRLEESI